MYSQSSSSSPSFLEINPEILEGNLDSVSLNSSEGVSCACSVLKTFPGENLEVDQVSIKKPVKKIRSKNKKKKLKRAENISPADQHLYGKIPVELAEAIERMEPEDEVGEVVSEKEGMEQPVLETTEVDEDFEKVRDDLFKAEESLAKERENRANNKVLKPKKKHVFDFENLYEGEGIMSIDTETVIDQEYNMNNLEINVIQCVQKFVILPRYPFSQL